MEEAVRGGAKGVWLGGGVSGITEVQSGVSRCIGMGALLMGVVTD